MQRNVSTKIIKGQTTRWRHVGPRSSWPPPDDPCGVVHHDSIPNAKNDPAARSAEIRDGNDGGTTPSVPHTRICGTIFSSRRRSASPTYRMTARFDAANFSLSFLTFARAESLPHANAWPYRRRRRPTTTNKQTKPNSLIMWRSRVAPIFPCVFFPCFCFSSPIQVSAKRRHLALICFWIVLFTANSDDRPDGPSGGSYLPRPRSTFTLVLSPLIRFWGAHADAFPTKVTRET